MSLPAFQVTTLPSTLKPIWLQLSLCYYTEVAVKVPSGCILTISLPLAWCTFFTVVYETRPGFSGFLLFFHCFLILGLFSHSSSCPHPLDWGVPHDLVFGLLFSIYIPFLDDFGLKSSGSFLMPQFLLVGWFRNLLTLLLKYIHNRKASYSSTCSYHCLSHYDVSPWFIVPDSELTTLLTLLSLQSILNTAAQLIPLKS